MSQVAARSATAPTWAPEAGGIRQLGFAFLHLLALSSLAFAEPLFDLLRKNPEFFAARGSAPVDIVVFAVGWVLVPPLALVVVEGLVALASQSAARILHLLFVAGLVALIVSPTLKRLFELGIGAHLALAIAVGLAVAALYARISVARSFVSALAIAPVLFLALLLLFSPVSKLVFPSEASARAIGGVPRAPVVVVLFDEFPVVSLLDSRGQIDARRYPNFAALAADGTWYRNAYTVYDSTERAQPAIMDGNYPRRDRLPTASDHPHSIFTLLGRSYSMNVSEEATSVCPTSLCKDERTSQAFAARVRSMVDDLSLVWAHVVAPEGIEERLPSVSQTWGNFGGSDDEAEESERVSAAAAAAGERPNTRANLNGNRNHRFLTWVARIRPSVRPSLNFKHTLLPHVPWQYLPTGQQYRRVASDPIPGINRYSYRDPGQVAVLWQRHLLQVGFADYLLGRLIRHLKQSGLYDKALIAIAADHGVAFDVGVYDRRRLTRRNAEAVGAIPFILKAPFQRRGRIDDSYVETVDILPTILRTLGVDPRVKMDGHPAGSAVVRRRRRVRIFERGTFRPLVFSAREWQQRKQALLRRKLALFGEGADGPWRFFEIGPNKDLLRKPVSAFASVRAAGLGARFVERAEYRNVDPRSSTVPVWVTGTVTGSPRGATRDVAVAVNGTIVGVGRTFHLVRDQGENFSIVVPWWVFRRGRNDVAIYEVRRFGARTTLALIGKAP
ncbi:sulfatase-like hydrolase/transferase [Thermoleophilum album]|uniref:Arylsulfatase A n=1 Tax=Thermoleophilum album TaxID=29539 RepID=A0A1H6FYY2_THEAL|nr:sulfatase-like hydrolase/transferase [Thermoleophilum album]SEH15223.1 Arylsulfatase A [Thermoleophilum album]